jgi:deazaflavin-dependent oxidoreductase (nitroreductase family)
MPKAYRHTGFKRFGNGFLTRVVRRGRGPKPMHLVTVRGRKSGKEYSTPFWLLELPDGRYWVSVFGETDTIKNARAAGHVSVSRGATRDEVRLVEVPVESRLPFLHEYVASNKSSMVRTYFATPTSSDDELRALAPEHTVFKLEPA